MARRVVCAGAAALIVGVMLAALLALPASSWASDVPPRWGSAVLLGHVSTDGAAFWATQIAVADFNGDGHQDVLIARDSMDAQHTFPVTILLGDGNGHFTDRTSSTFQGRVPQTQYARQIVIADFNGDHRPDVFIADTGDDHDPFPGYQNTLILSAPGGKLVDATTNLPQVNDYTHSAAAADVNGDGTTDLYIGNIYGANRVPPRILLNDGTGHFSVASDLLPAAQTNLDQNVYTGTAFVDVNGDGHPDLVLTAANSTPQSVVLLNDETGHFHLLSGALPAKPFGTDAIGFDPTPLNINSDGHPDLVISYTKGNPSYVGRWIQVLINNGDGTFRDVTASRLSQSDNSLSWTEFLQLGDLEHNGRTGLGLQTNPLWGGPPLLYLLDQSGVFHPGPVVGGDFETWAFIDAEGDGSNDISGVASNGDVWLVPELRQPRLSSLKLTPTTFRARPRGGSVSRAALGTKVSYQDSTIATTTFTVERALPGVMRGHNCLAPSRRPTRRGIRCTRYVALPGSFTHADRAGANHFHFAGRVGGRTLKPGNYGLDATPKTAARVRGRAIRSTFSIIP